MINIPVKDITDTTLRKAFEEIVRFTSANSILSGEWKFLEITLDSAVTAYKYPHNLPFAPVDVIQVSITGTGSLTWNYSAFDSTHLNLTTTGPCKVRAFIGYYKEG